VIRVSPDLDHPHDPSNGPNNTERNTNPQSTLSAGPLHPPIAAPFALPISYFPLPTSMFSFPNRPCSPHLLALPPTAPPRARHRPPKLRRLPSAFSLAAAPWPAPPSPAASAAPPLLLPCASPPPVATSPALLYRVRLMHTGSALLHPRCCTSLTQPA
jgi:hypothetical protein